ncbi:MAG TPA: hypothetical protein VJV78_11615 [Polyangiales bacterium]|nr:hypothetical protein [Polyangiales bacterium]
MLRIAAVISCVCLVSACCEARRYLNDPACSEEPEPEAGPSEPAPAPVVMLLIDTSGSMSQLPECECSDFSCSNCFPNCSAGEQNRWFTVLASLTGSYQNFGCQELSRTAANGATYDEGYSMPLYRLATTTTQNPDGLLDEFAQRIQFGLATFDGEYTYRGGTDLIPLSSFDFSLGQGMPGLFSYGGASPAGPRFRPDGSEIGRVFYPGCFEPYYVDSGIRSVLATDGALSLPAANAPAVLRAQLAQTRPYAGTPIAASLDDLYSFFASDPSASVAAGRKRHVVLVTDGSPDNDFRELGCDCAAWGTCDPWTDPAQVSCPYPSAPDAARHLICGFDPSACSGVVDAVHVVGLSVSDVAARANLDAIAADGGTGNARFASNQAELRAALRAVFESVSAGP